jgi:hypothetical protein
VRRAAAAACAGALALLAGSGDGDGLAHGRVSAGSVWVIEGTP